MPQPQLGFSVAGAAFIPPAPTTPAPPTTQFRFLDLPVELRVQVYTYLVVVGMVFYTPDVFEVEEGRLYRDHESFRQPCLSILQVSKSVHEEAGHLYLTANTFVLPHKWTSLRPFRKDSAARPLFADTAIKKIKHIAVMLDSRAHEWPLTMSRADWCVLEEETNFSFNNMTPGARLEIAHTKAHAWLENLRWNMSEKISEFESLQSVYLDVTNAYCPFGSCRMFDHDWEKAFKHIKSVRFIVKDLQESTEILDLWTHEAQQTREQLDQRFHIEFVVDDWMGDPTPVTP